MRPDIESAFWFWMAALAALVVFLVARSVAEPRVVHVPMFVGDWQCWDPTRHLVIYDEGWGGMECVKPKLKGKA